MHITLNLLPPSKKASLRKGYIAAYIRAMLVFLLIVAIALSAMLISFRMILTNTLADLAKQNEDMLSEDTAPEKNIEIIDAFLNRVDDLQGTFIAWSDMFEAISRITPEGVILDIVRLNPDGKIFIRGIAATRVDVLSFQSRLDDLPFFTEINAPLSNILKKTDVTFDFETSYMTPIDGE